MTRGVVTPEQRHNQWLGRWGFESPESRFQRNFDAKVDRSGGPDACWEWTGSRNRRPAYGAIRAFDGRMVKAHRVALEGALGRPLRDGYLALHHCDNPPCVNPAHLYEGTYSDNMFDRARRTPAPPVTHCKRGHPLVAPHVRIGANGGRKCGTCDNASRRRAGELAVLADRRLRQLGGER